MKLAHRSAVAGEQIDPRIGRREETIHVARAGPVRASIGIEEGEEFELRMECDKGCDGQDLSFDLDCTLDEFDLLDCEANQYFTNYGFFEFEQTAD